MGQRVQKVNENMHLKVEVIDTCKMGNFDSSLGQSLLEGFVLTCLYTQKPLIV